MPVEAFTILALFVGGWLGFLIGYLFAAQRR